MEQKIDLQSTICALELPGHKIYDTGYTIQESEAEYAEKPFGQLPPRYATSTFLLH